LGGGLCHKLLGKFPETQLRDKLPSLFRGRVNSQLVLARRVGVVPSTRDPVECLIQGGGGKMAILGRGRVDS